MESHEQVAGLIFLDFIFGFLVHVIGYRVVDIEECGWKLGGAEGHVFAQRSVDIHLAGYRNTSGGQPGIDIAGHEPEVAFERRPAFVGENAVFRSSEVILIEPGQRYLILGELLQEVRIGITLSQFLGHVFGDFFNLRRILGFKKNIVEVELAVFHDLHAQVEQGFDRCVAGIKVLRTRTEGEDFKLL